MILEADSVSIQQGESPRLSKGMRKHLRLVAAKNTAAAATAAYQASRDSKRQTGELLVQSSPSGNEKHPGYDKAYDKLKVGGDKQPASPVPDPSPLNFITSRNREQVVARLQAANLWGVPVRVSQEVTGREFETTLTDANITAEFQGGFVIIAGLNPYYGMVRVRKA